MPERRSPLHDYHLRHAGPLVRGGGDYLFPLSYGSPVDEHLNTRRRVGVQDLSSMGEVDIKGPGAERLLDRLLVNRVMDMQPGQMRYSTLCDEQGGIVDDVTLYKFDDEHFMVVTSSGPRAQTHRWIAEHASGASTYVTDVSRGIGLASLQGPHAREMLRTLLAEEPDSAGDVERLPFFRFVPTRIRGTDVLLSRSGYTGELGYELYAPADEIALLWETLLAHGKAYGLHPYGVVAMNSLRVEKGFPLYGQDINRTVTPFHAGLDRWIRFDKPRFVGRDALLRVQDAGIDTRWVGLVLEGPTPANVDDVVTSVADVTNFRARRFSGGQADTLTDGELPGERLGHVTVSVRGHTVDSTLAMAYVRTTHAWPGAKVLVISAGQPILATVTATPFFDPTNARMRAKAADDPARAIQPRTD